MTIRSEIAGAGIAASPQLAAFWRASAREAAAVWPVFALAAAYLSGTLLLAWLLPGDHRVAPFAYAELWLRAGIPFGLLYLIVRALPGILRERPDRPLVALGQALYACVTPAAALGVALISTQVLVKGTFTSVKNMLPAMSGYVWDGVWADVDRFLSGGVDPWRWLEPAISQVWALHAIEIFYLKGWMLLICLVPAIVAFAPRFRAIRLRFFFTYILSWIVIGNVLALAGMSAGPVYYGKVTGDAARFQPLLDYLAADSTSEYSAFRLQNALWHVYELGMMSIGTGISAFPSMHVGAATLWLIVALHAGRTFTVAATVFLLLVLISSVALGWHYAIDGYASILIVGLIWYAVGRLLPRPAAAP